MAQSFVRVPNDGTGKRVDTYITDVANYHRQVIAIGDPGVDGNLVTIDNDGRLPSKTEQQLDYDTGAGSVPLSIIGVGLPSSGGPVAGGTSSNPIRVDPTGTTSQPVTGPLTDAQLRASAVAVSASSLPLPTGAATESTLSNLNSKVTTVNTDSVTISSALPSGTNNIGDVDVLSIPGIVGTVADDSPSPGNPIQIGGIAKDTDGTDPGSVSDENDVTRVITDRNRRLLVNCAHPNLWSVTENHSSAQTNNLLKNAPGSSLCLYITDIIFSNGPTAGSIKLVQDPSGTPVDIFGPVYVADNGGIVVNLITPIRLSTNTALGFTSVTVTNHTVTVNGYIAP